MKQQGSSTKRQVLNAQELQPVLHEISPVGGGAMPTKVVGWHRRGVFTRAQANYPNGWGLTIYFDKAGKVSSWTASYSARAAVGLANAAAEAAGREAPAERCATIADSDGDDGA